LAAVGIFIGAIIFFFGFVALNPSVADVFGSRSPNTVTTENYVLQQQLSLLSPRVSILEIQIRQLHQHADKLQTIVDSSMIFGDNLTRYTSAAEGILPRPLIPAAISYRP
jgi:hypothetical protein